MKNIRNHIKYCNAWNRCSKYFAGGGATSPVHKELYEAGMNEDRTETDYATKLENVPSCGTYKLTEWIRDQHRVFEKMKTQY